MKDVENEVRELDRRMTHVEAMLISLQTSMLEIKLEFKDMVREFKGIAKYINIGIGIGIALNLVLLAMQVFR
jgi:hypothetical protein